jgi:hypothetical protein
MKKIVISLAIIILLGAGICLAYFFHGHQVKNGASVNAGASATLYGLKNATYLIEGEPITLVDGLAEKDIVSGSASKQITKFFGDETVGDLNSDGRPDVAFILTQDNGGSGTFYYVAAALATTTGYQGTNAIFLGDRIAPQSTQIQGGEAVVNYADRNPGEPFAAQPSVGVTKYFKIVDGNLTEVK